MKGSKLPEAQIAFVLKHAERAMSVGCNHHFPDDTIMPRHLLQTAELAGVGTPLIRSIFGDLATNAEKQTDSVLNKLPRGFPDQLIASVHAAVKSRSALLANTSKEAADA